jgi:hypothetical protein
MSFPNEVLDLLRSLRDPLIDPSSLNDSNKAYIAKKFLEFNEKGLLYDIREIDHGLSLQSPIGSTVYTYIIYAAEIMKYAYQDMI